jgi:hypothetical protein
MLLRAVCCVALVVADASAAAQQAPARANLSGLLAPRKPRVAPAEPELAEIASALVELAKRRDADAASAAIEDAKRALAAARAAITQGQRARSERNKQVAWAALALASRRIALANTARLKAAAERRANAAERELAATRDALERERERAGSRHDAAPAGAP